jgi:DNA-binding response OmpR family regulator
VRVVVICAEPDLARAAPDSIATILADLGCAVELSRFDLGSLDHDALARRRPDLIVVEAADELLRANRAIRRLREQGALVETPALVAITVARMPALDYSVGFDDFVLLPIVPAELYARLRQLDWRTARFGSDEVFKIDDLVIDVAGYEAHVAGRRLDLTHQEFELLRFLAQHRGRVFTREQLLERVWGYQYAGGSRTVDIHVRRVRAKLGHAAGGLIETVRHVGYKMRAPGARDEGGE